MKIDDELSKALRKGFIEHDFTVGIQPDLSTEQIGTYNKLKKRISEIAQRSLVGLGIRYYKMNLSNDHPLKLLLNTDSSIFANIATHILSDERMSEDYTNQFHDLFGNVIDYAIPLYCKSKVKTEKDLTDDDMQIIRDKAAEAVTKAALEFVFHGQQAEEISEIATENSADEDFTDNASSSKNNLDRINHYKKWFHTGSVGETDKSLDDPDVGSLSYEQDETLINKTLLASYLEKLDDKKKKILLLSLEGKTQTEIAEILGYHNNSAVSKSIKAMREEFHRLYLNEEGTGDLNVNNKKTPEQ